MRDRHNLEALLIRRFPGASREQIAAAANAVMALIEQWDHEEPRTPPVPSAPRPIASGRL